MMSRLVGPRSVDSAIAFMKDIRSRVTQRIQLTTDGFAAYELAVPMAFQAHEVHWAMLVKEYGSEADPKDPSRRYSPPVCTGALKVRKIGRPDPDLVSTSYIERSNFLYYNYCRPHQSFGRKVTPAMASGLTDRVWTVDDIVTMMDPTTARIE